jgi:sugar lactone lactonase YvrE
MRTVAMFRRLLVVAISALLGLAATSTPALAAHDSFPARIELPAGFQPEGIAIGPGPFGYFGSLADGDIYRADLRTGEGRVISQGPGTQSVGMKTDARGRLFVAGGAAGDARVVDTRTGRVLASYQLAATTTTFVNDVVLTSDAAWFTDSFGPTLYKLPLRHGKLPSQAQVTALALTGDYVQTEGFNANGLTSTPDHRALLVVQSSTGKLFRVDPRSGNATEVDLGGQALPGDGMLLRGRTLYVVLGTGQVSVLRLDAAGTTARQVRTLTDDGFDVPTTVAAFGNRLYLPNARFSTTPEPTTRYWVTAVSLC